MWVSEWVTDWAKDEMSWRDLWRRRSQFLSPLMLSMHDASPSIFFIMPRYKTLARAWTIDWIPAWGPEFIEYNGCVGNNLLERLTVTQRNRRAGAGKRVTTRETKCHSNYWKNCVAWWLIDFLLKWRVFCGRASLIFYVCVRALDREKWLANVSYILDFMAVGLFRWR